MNKSDYCYLAYKLFWYLGVLLAILGVGSGLGFISFITVSIGKLLMVSSFISWGLSGLFGYLSNKEVVIPFTVEAGDRDNGIRGWAASVSVVMILSGAAICVYLVL